LAKKVEKMQQKTLQKRLQKMQKKIVARKVGKQFIPEPILLLS